jgi:hypothetical protein
LDGWMDGLLWGASVGARACLFKCRRRCMCAPGAPNFVLLLQFENFPDY